MILRRPFSPSYGEKVAEGRMRGVSADDPNPLPSRGEGTLQTNGSALGPDDWITRQPFPSEAALPKLQQAQQASFLLPQNFQTPQHLR